MASPWAEKYRPKSVRDMVGFKKYAQKINKGIATLDQDMEMLKNLRAVTRKVDTTAAQHKKAVSALKAAQNKTAKNRAFLLMGQPGVGKTTFVYALANDLGAKVAEINSSDHRTKALVKEALTDTVASNSLDIFLSGTQATIERLILVDEVDGMHGNHDRGGVASVIEIILESKYPVFMTCNFDDPKLRPIKKIATVIKISPLQDNEISARLKWISEEEGVQISDQEIRSIVERCGGDLRSCVNDLQSIASGAKKIAKGGSKAVNTVRDTTINEAEFLENVMAAQTVAEARNAVWTSDVPLDLRHRWISLIIPRYFRDIKAAKLAWENLAAADRVMGRLKRIQDYSMLPFANDLMSAGITLVQDSITRRRIGRVGWLRWIRGRNLTENEVAIAIQRACLVSKRESMQEVAVIIRNLATASPDYKSRLMTWLDLDSKQLDVI